MLQELKKKKLGDTGWSIRPASLSTWYERERSPKEPRNRQRYTHTHAKLLSDFRDIGSVILDPAQGSFVSSLNIFRDVSNAVLERPALVFDDGLKKELNRAREAILELKDDWDGEGSSGYHQTTWDRAEVFVTEHVKSVFQKSGRIPIPKILPGPDESIDLHWRTDCFELLVNVPASHDDPVSFYGDDYSDQSSIKGTFDAKSVSRVLVEWLVQTEG